MAHFWREMIQFQIPENETVITDMIRAFKRAHLRPTKHVVEWDDHGVFFVIFPICSI